VDCGDITSVLDRPGRGNLLARLRSAAARAAVWVDRRICANPCHLYTCAYLVVQSDAACGGVYLRICVGIDVLDFWVDPAGIDQSRGVGCADFCAVSAELIACKSLIVNKLWNRDMPDKQDVNQIFDSVTPRYDLANRILSLGLDLRWRRQAVQMAGIGEGMRVIDLCCGSGDMAFAAVNAVGEKGYVCGYDAVEAMLGRAREKWETMRHKYKYPKELAEWMTGDCEQLNEPAQKFDAATCAFGIRNVSNISQFMTSTYGVLRPGGRIGILEY
jgi:hypothetical protein